ncbi:MAG TPA: OmpA family protein [Gemmatimonadales bacterium]|nr:OmpA family protein [Gemmatimonadales bacterium]
MRALVTAAIVLAALAAPAAAQEKGTWELGAFGRYTDYSKSYEPVESSNGFGAGLRIGYFVSPKFSIELMGSGNWTDVYQFFVGQDTTELSYWPMHLRLIYNQKLGGDDSRFSFFLGGGPNYNKYGKDIAGIPGFEGSDWGIGGIAGFRLGLASWLALRVDGTIDYIPSPNNGSDEVISRGAGITQSPPPDANTNLGLQAGLSLMLGGCNRTTDGTTLTPNRATVETGQTATFTANATACGKPDEIVWSLSGPGQLANGTYTAADSGRATITACGRKNRLCSTAAVEAMPPERVVSITVQPATANTRTGDAVSYTITGRTNRNNTQPVTDCTLSSPGGTVSGMSVTWDTPGTKTVTITCAGGVTSTATVEVRLREVPFPGRENPARAHHQFDQVLIFRTEDQDTLRKLAAILRENPEIKIVIDGHADSDGRVEYNAELGRTRAEAVREFLRAEGVPLDRMTVLIRSFGECKPRAGNNMEEGGRELNRRTEMYQFMNESDLEAAVATCRDTRRRPLP